MSKLILHEALPARIAESPFLQPVFQVAAEVEKSIRGPLAYKVTGVYLEEEYNTIKEWVNAFKPIWEKRGVIIMCDGWKGTRNQHIINFLIYSPRDNEAAVKAGGKILMQKRRHLYCNFYMEAIPQMMCLMGVRSVIQRIEPNMNNQVLAMNQLLLYRDKMDSFGTPLAQAAILRTNPAEWWINYGSCAPQLQRIAIKVLSQTTLSSNCERNWSSFSLIHTKKRNRLKHRKLQKLVYVHYNMRLKLRHMQRKSAQELEISFNPINLDNIFKEEREDATLDGEQNFSWLPE
ncbi:hypothetical protein PVK06_019294 [Gossypium arboreum]|uniref:HAT C-terminal dimerisation domain-containing protein n=1 Tax=Gossypium arboreum TaxID=29729 RepID=A0ABR0PJK9_GOSAR|nr:hypothetical protein PVK06_019294 [Gossypium arboreum]